jgi:hypothetical protein
MMRRLVSVAVVLVLSGLLPLAASVGACGTKHCCRAQSHDAALANRGCCGHETNCLTAARDVQATAAASVTVAPQLVATVSIATRVARAAAATPARIDAAPPPTRQRLAALSILLI